jgi:hypothetical protein
MFEKEAKLRAKDYTENKERQIAYRCGFLDGTDFACNKAKEEFDWHYDDYPEPNKECVCKDFNDMKFFAYYDGDDWITQDDEIVTRVSCWKYI